MEAAGVKEKKIKRASEWKWSLPTDDKGSKGEQDVSQEEQREAHRHPVCLVDISWRRTSQAALRKTRIVSVQSNNRKRMTDVSTSTPGGTPYPPDVR